MGDEKESYKVRIKGTRPLLMHSCHGMVDDRIETPSRGKKEITLREEAEKILYIDEKGNPVVPFLAILGCLRRSATNYKVSGKGKKTYKDFIYSGLGIKPENIPVISKDDWEVDLRPVGIKGNRIVRARPKFKEWELEFEIEILDVIIIPSVLKEMLIDAGKYSGLLDFRPLFGLFDVTEFEKLNKV